MVVSDDTGIGKSVGVEVELLLDDANAIVGRTIVDKEELDIAESLLEKGFAKPIEVFCPIVDRNGNSDFRHKKRF